MAARGKARTLTPKELDDLSAITPRDIDDARAAWKRDAPREFSALLDAEPPKGRRDVRTPPPPAVGPDNVEPGA